MTQQLSFEGGGQLEWTQEGSMIRLTARRPEDGAGLYKVWLHGSDGTCLLGTLIPEDGQLILKRTLSRDWLKQVGCWPVVSVSCVMSFTFTDVDNTEFYSPWHWDHHPGRLFSDPVLSEAASAWGSMLMREGNHGFQLAIPADPHHPFPLLPIFCLAGILHVDGQLHVTFTFHPSGEPKFPE